MFFFQVLAEKYGIGKSTASDIIKRKDIYKGHWESNATPDKQRFGNDAKFDRINDLVWDWFCTVRSKNIPLSGPIIQEKALYFAQELGLDDFRASNGWLGRWKTRHSIKAFKVSGESAGVDIDTVEGFKSKIPEFIENYEHRNIFNCDETGLYFRALPDRTLATKSSGHKGTKVSKDRITVMFACSATGEKLKPLVIGKAANPRCFKNVKKSNMKVTYVSNKRAWMNNKVFSDWINNVDVDMRNQKRKILLMLDNASSHGQEDDYSHLTHVKVKFLPANTTSHLQPLDAGIIRTFKAYYRQLMLRTLLCKMDSSSTAQQLCKEVTLLDAIEWTVTAWDRVKCDTIVNCFASVGFGCDQNVATAEPVDEYEDDDVPLIVLVQQFRYTMDDFETLEEGLQTEDNSDEWEQNLLNSYKVADTPNESEDECENDQVCNLTHCDILKMLHNIKHFAQCNDTDYIDKVQDMLTMTEKKIVKMRCSAKKQTTLDAYFK